VAYVYLNSTGECNPTHNGGCARPRTLAERRRRRLRRAIYEQQQRSAAAASARKSATIEKLEKSKLEAIEIAKALELREEIPEAHSKVNLDAVNNVDETEESDDAFTFSPVQFAKRFTSVVTVGGDLSLDDVDKTHNSTIFSTPSTLFSVLDFDISRDRILSTDTEEGLGERGPPNVSELFDLLDTDGNGELSLEEVVTNHEHLSMTKTEAARLFKRLDPHGRGSINRKEFGTSLGLLGGVTNWAGELLGFGERPKFTSLNRKQAEQAQQDSRNRMLLEREPSVIAFSGLSGVRLGSTI